MQSLDFSVARLSSPRVLIAEDDEATRRIVQRWVQKLGYGTVLAVDGTQAWEILQQNRPPELVIADWEMPGIDGIELCRRLRDESRDYYHYFLMITGKSDRLDGMRALEAGADDCLTKPLQEDELKTRLIVASRILSLQDGLISAREESRMQAMKDPLTGLWNRTAFLDLFQRELDRAARSQGSTGLLLLDLDKFKKVNDTFGHLTGDIVLKEAAHRLKRSVRSFDFVGRFGGEEFLIALPGCTGSSLRKRAEAIRLAIAVERVRVDNIEIPITTSIGAVVARVNERSTLSVLADADTALYTAKNAGRNRVVYCERNEPEIVSSAESLLPTALPPLQIRSSAASCFRPAVVSL